MSESQINEPQAIPNSTTILVLGICSIATCWCFGIIGLGLGITALVMSKKARLLFNSYPSGTFTESSYGNMNAGRICAIIGVCLSSLAVLYFAFYLIIFGFIFSQAGMHSPGNYNLF